MHIIELEKWRFNKPIKALDEMPTHQKKIEGEYIKIA